ncbi:MAG: OmpA family protein [Proteobacteria bacterium]|nr:OmpA family protein [Pseudomonadota bacterium]
MHRQVLTAILVSLTLLAGCVPVQQAATSPDYHKTRAGAGIGAAAGAAIGLLTRGDKFQNALIGAAIGGVAGGAIGNYQDRQEKQLRASMAGTGVDVVRKDDNITLDMPGGVTFATNSSDLNAAFYPVLDKVAATLVQYDQTMVEVAGHTDSTGSAQYNQALSQRRAQSVAAYLINRGVRAARLMTVGDGENHPIASNDTADGRAQNRRVELTIVPVEKKG